MLKWFLKVRQDGQIERIRAEGWADNSTMLRVCETLGFSLRSIEASVVKATIAVQPSRKIRGSYDAFTLRFSLDSNDGDWHRQWHNSRNNLWKVFG